MNALRITRNIVVGTALFLVTSMWFGWAALALVSLFFADPDDGQLVGWEGAIVTFVGAPLVLLLAWRLAARLYP
jgi:hypothetical protein